MTTWSAISRPPYLTALTLWTHVGYWDGGGVFASDRHLQMVRYLPASPLGDGFPSGFGVTALSQKCTSQFGPILETRLIRNGWALIHAKPKRWSAVDASARPYEMWRKESPAGPDRLLDMKCFDLVPWMPVYAVCDRNGEIVIDLAGATWADWCPSGDLLYAAAGKIFRLDVFSQPADAREMVDLSDLRFSRREAPAWARTWTRRRARSETVSRLSLVYSRQVDDG